MKNMEKLNFDKLKLVRDRMGLTQEQMAERLSMSQSNYNKLEKGQRKYVDYELLERIAKALNISFYEICGLLSEDKNQKAPHMKLKTYEDMVNSFVFESYQQHSDKYEESCPWEKLDLLSKEYVFDCGVKNKAEYEKLPHPLVGFVSEQNEQIAFEEMLNNMNIYSCFKFGLVTDDFLLRKWTKFIEKETPKFLYKYENGWLQITRKEFAEWFKLE